MRISLGILSESRVGWTIMIIWICVVVVEIEVYLINKIGQMMSLKALLDLTRFCSLDPVSMQYPKAYDQNINSPI